jgi:hypothetical protein
MGPLLVELKIGSSEKLIVFFGCMNIIDLELSKFEETFGKQIEVTIETDRLKAMEIQRAREKKEKEATHDLRVKIVDMLNKSGEIKEISDMFNEPFKEPSPFTDFNPILFVMHLPLSLQKMSLEERDAAEAEDFIIAYDGEIVMVGAVCSQEKQPWGVYDARDKLLTMLKTLKPEVEMTAPCLTHEGIVFLTNPPKTRKEPSDLYVKIDPEAEIVDILRNLYVHLVHEIKSFYATCGIREAADKVVRELDQHRSEVLLGLWKFMATTWRHPLARAKLVGQMKKSTIQILEKLSDYSSLKRDLRDWISSIEESRAHNGLFNSYIEKIDLKEYTTPEEADSEALMRIIEHVRSETESYGSYVSTLLSALAGAIIGSALTLLTSYLLGHL